VIFLICVRMDMMLFRRIEGRIEIRLF